MVTQQQEFQYSKYSSLYDIIVPKDNLLRRINEGFSVIDALGHKVC